MPHLNSTPLVSIITPAYNAEKFLRETLDSVANQSFADYEHLIIDDCSSDATASIVASASTDPRVRVHRNARNLGVAATRNVGLDLARGQWVAFLDSDDRWRPEKLAEQLTFMQRTGAKVSYMDYQRTDLAGKTLGRVTPPAQIDFSGMLKSNVIGNLSAMAQRAAIGDTRFRKIGHEDYVFWLEVLRGGITAHKVQTQEPLCLYRVADSSLSANKFRAAAWQWNIYRDVLKLNPLTSAWYFGNYVASAIRKRV